MSQADQWAAEHLIPAKEPAHLLQSLDSSCYAYQILTEKVKNPDAEFSLHQGENKNFLTSADDKQNPREVTEY